ncbi:hypothetical protein EDWATA_00083 [Edwardsiella tarda ATCC 23685]|uniref:Uncharacterized protein n=1 Tax=Edwardsiella tarda ATCC 23685 TaxID=500638 RepID=D4F059_EDWTA|nr:hypothetical protein EDWATA_00083 [Edwardsiella tarda ATCC 23685]
MPGSISIVSLFNNLIIIGRCATFLCFSLPGSLHSPQPVPLRTALLTTRYKHNLCHHSRHNSAATGKRRRYRCPLNNYMVNKFIWYIY